MRDTPLPVIRFYVEYKNIDSDREKIYTLICAVVGVKKEIQIAKSVDLESVCYKFCRENPSKEKNTTESEFVKLIYPEM